MVALQQDNDPDTDRTLLIVDDDGPSLRGMSRALEKRGFDVSSASSAAQARRAILNDPPAYMVVELRLEDGNGLDVIELLRQQRPASKIVVVTGFAAIATAVAAVKFGAKDYLAKPADIADVTSALLASDDCKPDPPENPMSADRVRWEHIQRVYELCDRNVSETARRLNMHRRTLQRILSKKSPR